MKGLRLAVVILALGAAAGCRRFGTVNQGWVVEYLAAEGKITLIPDSGPATPVTILVPENPAEMGPPPAAGRLVGVDMRERQFTVFDPGSRSLKKVPFTLLSQADSVRRDDPRITGRRLPVIDQERGTAIIYVPHERRLLTVRLAGESLVLPAETWRVGELIRYYYKDPQRALRLMNVSRTDINKAGE